jgi:hypothetical protein
MAGHQLSQDYFMCIVQEFVKEDAKLHPDTIEDDGLYYVHFTDQMLADRLLDPNKYTPPLKQFVSKNCITEALKMVSIHNSKVLNSIGDYDKRNQVVYFVTSSKYMTFHVSFRVGIYPPRGAVRRDSN